MADNSFVETDSGIVPQRPMSSELVEQYAMLLTRARLLTSNAADAADLVHDTLVRALKAARRFKKGSNLRAWLLRIMRNLFVDCCRTRKRLRRFYPGEMNALEAVEAGTPTPADLISRSAIDAAIDGLRPFHREIFRMAYLDCLSHREIARRLKIPQSTASVRLWRAKRKIQQTLKISWGCELPEERVKQRISAGGRP
jgi:RNA polymerase sigma-70 factor (ECF subfamily)